MRIGQNSAINFASQVVASVLGFAANIYLARRLGPDGLGAYFLVVAVLIWLKIVGGMGITTAVRKRLSEDGPDAPYLAAGLLTQVAVYVVLAGVLFMVRGYVREYLRGVSVMLVIGLLGITLWLQFMMAVLDGQHKVHLSSALVPIERLVRSVTQVGAVFLGYALTGMLFGYGVAALVAVLLGLVFANRTLAVPGREHVKDLFSYAQYSWLGTLSSRAFISMDTLVLGLFVADGFIGIYEIAWNLASILAVFGISISKAMFPEVSRLSSEDSPEAVAELINSALQYAGLFLIPGLVGGAIIGDLVLGVYGGEFSRGHLILVLLISARLAHTYGAQFINSLNAIDLPEHAFRINGVFATTNVALNLVLVYSFGWIGAATATSISAVVAALLAYRSITDVLTIELPIQEIAKQCLAALVMGVVVLASRLGLQHTISVTVIIISVGAAVYLVVLLGISREFRTTVRTNLPA